MNKPKKDTKKKKDKPLCDECKFFAGRFNDKHNLYLCDMCSKTEKFNIICKTTAKTKYFLKDSDLAEIKTYDVKNPHYRSGPPMILLKEAEVIDVFCKIYNTDRASYKQKLIEIAGNKDEKKKTLQEKKQIKQIEEEKRQLILREKLAENNLAEYFCAQLLKPYRAKKRVNYDEIIADVKKQQEHDVEIMNNERKRRTALIKALGECGLELRNDSELCSGYIDGTIEDSLEWVVKRMCQVKYLYEYCNIKAYFNEAGQSVREEYREMHEPIPKGAVFEEAERLALKKYNKGRYPEKFPWMK